MKTILPLLISVILVLAGSEAYAQRISNSNYHTIGYIKSDGTMQDGNYHTVGYFKSDGRVQDSNYRTIGYVKSDGTVQDGNYRTIGHASDVRRSWVAWYFFFLN